MNKKVLRKVYLEKRKTLTASEHQKRSESVCTSALSLLKEYSVKNIHLFLPILHQREVDTLPILNFLIKNPLFQPIVSATNFKTKEMNHFLVDDFTKFNQDRFGIPTPINAKQVSVEDIDIVLCPLISFDRLGNRIGYGGGYYDRFLRGCRGDIKIIGLALTPPLDLIPFTESHDYQMHACINHDQVFKFNA